MRALHVAAVGPRRGVKHARGPVGPAAGDPLGDWSLGGVRRQQPELGEPAV